MSQTARARTRDMLLMVTSERVVEQRAILVRERHLCSVRWRALRCRAEERHHLLVVADPRPTSRTRRCSARYNTQLYASRCSDVFLWPERSREESGWPTPLAARTYWPGEVPNQTRKSRDRWAWSA